MGTLGGGSFSAREVAYLQSLPAVERVSNKRIEYTEEFKRYVMRRYAAGDSPVAIFRAAGLDSALIGYKRIERCIARWKQTVDLSAEPAEEESHPLPAASYTPGETDETVETISKTLNPYMAMIQNGHYDVLIAHQLRRIDDLEREVIQLKARMDNVQDVSDDNNMQDE